MTIKGRCLKVEIKMILNAPKLESKGIGKFKQTFSEIQLDSTKNICFLLSDHRLFIVIENIDNYFLVCKI